MKGWCDRTKRYIENHLSQVLIWHSSSLIGIYYTREWERDRERKRENRDANLENKFPFSSFPNSHTEHNVFEYRIFWCCRVDFVFCIQMTRKRFQLFTFKLYFRMFVVWWWEECCFFLVSFYSFFYILNRIFMTASHSATVINRYHWSLKQRYC